ncbi:hypothetical protein I3843_12G110600 [Carya illinoinensis]|nr:hypothetical protein I3843_12G110600 [Carya illinoinensis]
MDHNCCTLSLMDHNHGIMETNAIILGVTSSFEDLYFQSLVQLGVISSFEDQNMHKNSPKNYGYVYDLYSDVCRIMAVLEFDFRFI